MVPGLARSAVLAALLLGGCETVEDTVSDTVGSITNVFDEPVLLPCPEYFIPADSANLVAFKPGPGRDLIDVDHSGKIGNLRTGCQYRINKKTNAGSVDLEIGVLFAVERGPANRSRRATYPYFIAITDDEKKVLYREQLKLPVDFSGNQNRRVVTGERVVLEVPLKSGQDGRHFRIYAGFLLNRQQLDYNRKLRRSRLR